MLGTTQGRRSCHLLAQRKTAIKAHAPQKKSVIKWKQEKPCMMTTTNCDYAQINLFNIFKLSTVNVVHQIFTLKYFCLYAIGLNTSRDPIIQHQTQTFNTEHVVITVWNIMNTKSHHLERKYAGIFVLGHYLFLVAHSFLWARVHSRKTNPFLEQIMVADKYPSIFSCQMEDILFKCNTWLNMPELKNGKYLSDIP